MSDSTSTAPPPPQRPYRVLIGFAVAALLALLASAGVKSYRDLADARTHEMLLRQEIEASEGRIRVLREYVRTIEGDPLTLERLAREELGLVRPGDVVIVLPQETSSQVAPSVVAAIPTLP